VAALSTFLALAAGEFLLRQWAPVADPFANAKRKVDRYIPSQFEPNLRLIISPKHELPGIEGQAVCTTNAMGFRGDELVVPKPADEYRVFLVGGSSAECLLLDDADALHAVLQRELQARAPREKAVRVYNAGKSGDRSYDHVSMIVHRIVHLEPDLLVVFAGINDLTAAIYGSDYLHLADGRRVQLTYGRLWRYWVSEFQIGRRLFYLRNRLLGRPEQEMLEQISLTPEYKDKVAARRAAPKADRLPRVEPSFYRNNLLSISGVADVFGIGLMFMTQQTTWNSKIDPSVENWQWMLLRGGVTYRAEAMDAGLESLNDVMRSVAASRRIPIYDLARSMHKSSEFFYDDVHFNVKGARVAGEELANVILSHNLISPNVQRSRNSPISVPGQVAETVVGARFEWTLHALASFPSPGQPEGAHAIPLWDTSGYEDGRHHRNHQLPGRTALDQEIRRL
jgi:lysophospholipase L1-like esterase